MDTGTLTPRTNSFVDAMRFTGGFAQPDGFGSVLLAEVKQDGRLVLTCSYKTIDGTERCWSIELDNDQRNAFSGFAGKYQPRSWERVFPDKSL